MKLATENRRMHWFILNTRPNAEKKVCENLSKRKVLHFCPSKEQDTFLGDKKRGTNSPLFKSYVFVYTTVDDLQVLLQIDNISNIVYWLGTPAIVQDEEIETIKHFIINHVNISLEKMPINLGDKVHALSSMFVEGNYIDVKNKSVKASLPSLGYTITADVKPINIALIPTKTASTRRSRVNLFINGYR